MVPKVRRRAESNLYVWTDYLKLRDPTLLKNGVCYVDGEWIPSRSGKTFEVTDPATGEFIALCPDFNENDTEAAIEASSGAFASFKALTGRERSKILRKWYDLAVESADDLSILVTWENGKPLTEATGEVKYALGFLEWFSEEAPRVSGDTILASNPNNRISTYKEPIGVCALITPWNFPAGMIARKSAPAIAAGCTVVVKAAAETPLTSLALAELAHRAGVPKGVFNVITTSSESTPAVGKVLTTHPIVKKVSFTGSTNIGKLLMQQSSSTLKKLSLELGGNAPFIVFDDADIDAAVAGAITCKFRGSGQTCVCANRIYVQKKIHDEFSHRFIEAIDVAFKVGNGFDKGTTHGPLIHDRSVARVEALVEDARAKGAKIFGGEKMAGAGSFFKPTVLLGATKDMKVSSEEIFGPVAALFPFETEAEVVDLANSSSVGLAGYIYSQDIHRIQRVAEHLEVGMVGANTGVLSDQSSPFGGVKESGYGLEGSIYGINEYLVTKTITYGGMGGPLQGRVSKI
ncbi:hypothetical protein G7046_g5925 [Stylonectria norvegica]|nr:hypothetical protein G7046_g5925 [Stylonectria norvegica]